MDGHAPLNPARYREIMSHAEVLLTFASLKCEPVPSESFVFDISRWDFSNSGDGKTYLSVRECLDPEWREAQ
jgi:hypothetical protein